MSGRGQDGNYLIRQFYTQNSSSLNSVYINMLHLSPQNRSSIYSGIATRSEIRSAGFSLWTVLIGRTYFDTTTSTIPNPTLSSK